jgi:hypothetical protein
MGQEYTVPDPSQLEGCRATEHVALAIEYIDDARNIEMSSCNGAQIYCKMSSTIQPTRSAIHSFAATTLRVIDNPSNEPLASYTLEPTSHSAATVLGRTTSDCETSVSN